MRREAPPERMTAASILESWDPGDVTKKARLARRCRLLALAEFLVRDARCVSSHRYQFRRQAHGNLFRRKRSNLYSHGRKHPRELLGLVSFHLQRLIRRQDL